MDLADHVLSHFTASQQKEMNDSIERASEAVRVIMEQGTDVAMNRFNHKKSQ